MWFLDLRLPQPEKSFAELLWEAVSVHACSKGHGRARRSGGNPHRKEREKTIWLFPLFSLTMDLNSDVGI